MKSYSTILAVGLFLIAALPGHAAIGNAEILDHRTVTLAAPEADRVTTLAFDLFGRDVELRLEDNHAPFAALDADQRTRIFAGGNRYFRGAVSGIDGSWLRLSWIDGHWSGGIFDGRELFLLEPAEAISGLLTREVPDDTLVLYRLSDLNLPELTLAPPVIPTGTSGESGTRPKGTIQGANEALPVTIVSDTQFSAEHSGNTAAVVAGRINFVDGIYGAEVDVGIALHHHEILTNNGTLTSTSASTLLEQFQSYMTPGGAGSGIPFEGLAHLFTGRDLDGDTAGIAFQGRGKVLVLCDSNIGYGVDRNLDFSETVSGLVFAHELGHNFDAPHDDPFPEDEDRRCEHEPGGRIMEPTISKMGTAHEFSDCSKQHMAVEINNATCLVDTVLFRDRFEQP